MQRTINLKIPYDERIAETVRLYNTACNVALKAGFIKGTYNKNQNPRRHLSTNQTKASQTQQQLRLCRKRSSQRHAQAGKVEAVARQEAALVYPIESQYVHTFSGFG